MPQFRPPPSKSKVIGTALNAIEEQADYKRKDAAKFRAVKNRDVMEAGGYDVFRNIVAAAHLKPLDKKEGLEFAQHHPGGVGANRISFREMQYGKGNKPKTAAEAAQAADAEGGQPANEEGASTAPADATVLPDHIDSAAKFTRVWKRDCKTPEARYALLRGIQPGQLESLFSSEIDSSLLTEMMSAMKLFAESAPDGKLADEDVRTQLLLLRSLTCCGRFGLAIQFFGRKEKEMADALFGHLSLAAAVSGDGVVTVDDVAVIRDLYLPSK